MKRGMQTIKTIKITNLFWEHKDEMEVVITYDDGSTKATIKDISELPKLVKRDLEDREAISMNSNV